MSGTRVTAIEVEPPAGAQPDVIITDGSAHVHAVQVHNLKDGTQTHVITVKGCKP